MVKKWKRVSTFDKKPKIYADEYFKDAKKLNPSKKFKKREGKKTTSIYMLD